MLKTLSWFALHLHFLPNHFFRHAFLCIYICSLNSTGFFSKHRFHFGFFETPTFAFQFCLLHHFHFIIFFVFAFSHFFWWTRSEPEEKAPAERTVSSPSSAKRVVRSTTTSLATAMSSRPAMAANTARTKLTKSKSDNPEPSDWKVSNAKKIFQGKWQKQLTKPAKDSGEHTRGGRLGIRKTPTIYAG
jgi:hypothetical protein